MKTLKNTVGTVKNPLKNNFGYVKKNKCNGQHARGPSEGLFDDRIERSV